MTLAFQTAGDLIYLVGEAKNDINSSEYLYSYHNIALSPAPYLDLEEEYKVQQTVKELIKARAITSAHDVSDGGLYIALLEAAMPKHLGFSIKTDSNLRKDDYLFGESVRRVVVSVLRVEKAGFEAMLQKNNTAFTQLGEVTSGACEIDGETWHDTNAMKHVYDTTLGKIMAN